MADELTKKMIAKRIFNLAESNKVLYAFMDTYLIYENILNTVYKFLELYECKKIILYTNYIKSIDRSLSLDRFHINIPDPIKQLPGYKDIIIRPGVSNVHLAYLNKHHREKAYRDHIASLDNNNIKYVNITVSPKNTSDKTITNISTPFTDIEMQQLTLIRGRNVRGEIERCLYDMVCLVKYGYGELVLYTNRIKSIDRSLFLRRFYINISDPTKSITIYKINIYMLTFKLLQYQEIMKFYISQFDPNKIKLVNRTLAIIGSFLYAGDINIYLKRCADDTCKLLSNIKDHCDFRTRAIIGHFVDEIYLNKYTSTTLKDIEYIRDTHLIFLELYTKNLDLYNP